MDDLISREDAIDAIYEHEFANWCDKDEVSTVLNDLPSAQPEIIRCKDCLIHGVCSYERGLGENGFCSQAKRRTDE
jgi:hypothetical protein